ncbi:HK97 family phage prohead protease [Bradyrhizobium sp. 190]|uniref:HK97 family phage prohead protease n=1 Tax=Bradyrhizobium sp. 190 TaxID=2782658 RepID=UPI001FF7974A|nr:HK97 family phage prohead protease [Bradyrhizobium sp. 190]MCK1517115.1 HK97 family phage prohead protease [Bradyrhizobium sp. 190]
MPGANFETRNTDAPDTTNGLIRGYAAVFQSPEIIAGQFIEQIAPGAFSETLKQGDVLALLAHDWSRVLGRQSAGSLRLKEDGVGLAFELDADLTTPSGQEVFGTVKRRDVHGCSFGFIVREESWTDDGDLPMRTLIRIDLREVSILANPAYTKTVAWVSQRASNNAAAQRRIAARRAAMRVRGML